MLLSLCPEKSRWMFEVDLSPQLAQWTGVLPRSAWTGKPERPCSERAQARDSCSGWGLKGVSSSQRKTFMSHDQCLIGGGKLSKDQCSPQFGSSILGHTIHIPYLWPRWHQRDLPSWGRMDRDKARGFSHLDFPLSRFWQSRCRTASLCGHGAW